MQGIVRLITVLLLVLSLGLHWAVLQTVAWTGMVVGYAQKVTVREALSRTFDGRHPCALCKAIQKGREAERRQQQQQEREQSLVKLDLALPWEAPVITFFSPRCPVPGAAAPALARPEAPPTPPPRAAGVEAA